MKVRGQLLDKPLEENNKKKVRIYI